MASVFSSGLAAVAASLLSVALLGACQENERRSGAVPDKIEDGCGSLAFQKLIGQKREALSGISTPGATRILVPNSIMTMDYRSDRLNIYLDRHGTIEKVSCG